MGLPVINNAPENNTQLIKTKLDSKQDENKSFSKICYIPSLGLSCFGCCGHHFADKKVMQRFFDRNKKTLERYQEKGKTYSDFMNREHLVASCGGCYSLIREKDKEGREQYLCSVHPLRIGAQKNSEGKKVDDIRVGYCDHDYLCKTAAHVNKMTDEEKALFYEFLKERKFNSFYYSMINAQETVLLELYREWKSKKTTS